MKRLTLIAVISALILTARVATTQEVAPCDFFPLKPETKWVYRCGADEVEIRVVRHEFAEVIDEKEKPSKLAVALVKLISGKREVYEQYAVLPDGVYRVSTAGHQIRPPLRILKIPERQGDSWTVQADCEGVPLKGTFHAGVDMKELYKDQATYAVTTRDFQVGGETTMITTWYAKNVGMVKQQVQVSKFPARVLELESMKQK